MRRLREQQFERRMTTRSERLALALWAWTARRPALYDLLAVLGTRVLAAWGGREARIRHLPGFGGWTIGRDFPAPEGRTFRELYRKRARAAGKRGP
jgi:L-lactate dehydrogenase complex protein LldF